MLSYWNLRRDPFTSGTAPYVATPVHENAVARIVGAVEAGDRQAALLAGAGLGKSVVLDEALTRLRHPLRRIARSVAPADGATLLEDLATRLGGRVPGGGGRAAAWRALVDALRLCRVQGLRVVLVVEGSHWLGDRADLERTVALGERSGLALTLLETARTSEGQRWMEPDPCRTAVGLVPLTRTEAGAYLTAKLFAAGRTDPVFTPSCVTRLHALAAGVPRPLDRLASRALQAGAARRLEVIGPEVAEELAAEFEPELAGVASARTAVLR